MASKNHAACLFDPAAIRHRRNVPGSRLQVPGRPRFKEMIERLLARVSRTQSLLEPPGSLRGGAMGELLRMDKPARPPLQAIVADGIHRFDSRFHVTGLDEVKNSLSV